MSISLRRFRAAIYVQSDGGTAGVAKPTWTRSNSGDTDKLWWCSVAVPTGREGVVGAAPQYRVDAVLGFAAEAPVATGRLIVVDTIRYEVRAVLPRVHGRNEVQVHAEKSQNTAALVNP